MLAQLKKKNTMPYDSVMIRLFRAFDDYNKDVDDYRDTKRLLLELFDKN